MSDSTSSLGAFSVSLAVKNLAASRAFYEALGFVPVGGDGETWQIFRNGTTVIGLFEGMFESNILTFNPRWNHAQETVDGDDIRTLEARFAKGGLPVAGSSTAQQAEGPASFTLTDPDGNTILFDQHL